VKTAAIAAATIVLLVGSGVARAQAPAIGDQPWMNRQLSPDQRADLLEAQMAQPEKIDLVTGVSVCGATADGWNLGSPRLGLPDLKLAGAGMGVTAGCEGPNGKATELPAPIAMAASWSRGVAYQDGALIGTETRDFGFNVAIGGDVNLARDPRNGRTFEAEGEDPYLAGTIVAAQLRGTQSRHIPATIKHFAFNNEEANRLTASSDVDERTMRELELRSFQIGIERSGVSAVMCSYNRVNGTPACADRHLLTDVLKAEWGFKGWVMTDWWACGGIAGNEGTCQTADAADAGLDQEQPNATRFGPALAEAVATGAVSQARLDDMVHRILRSLFASGLMDDPPTSRPIDVTAGAATAEKIEERSAVLLKNAGDLLPLRRDRIGSIAVIGAPAGTAPAQAEGCTIKQDDLFVFLCSSARANPIRPDTPLQSPTPMAAAPPQRQPSRDAPTWRSSTPATPRPRATTARISRWTTMRMP
jgi:beta-glucosidase